MAMSMSMVKKRMVEGVLGAEMLMDDASLLGPLGLGAPHGLVGAPVVVPLVAAHHQVSLKGHPQLDIPGKKLLKVAGAPALDAYHYQIMYAHCVQQQQQREREQQHHQQQQQLQQHPHQRGVLVGQPQPSPPHPHPHQPPHLHQPMNSTSAFRPWGPTTQKAFMHAYNATLSSLPYTCQEPPELQNPERVVRSTDKRYAERTYQPNVA
ncbi:GL19480 [Drosophila persimilis]|uniref:GL19480 n=1 Tax=Drosophila persimilis TaxID=7234 RepID=B4G9H1_DROPE|nr:GL19480 [Drosophila persimilis]